MSFSKSGVYWDMWNLYPNIFLRHYPPVRIVASEVAYENIFSEPFQSWSDGISATRLWQPPKALPNGWGHYTSWRPACEMFHYCILHCSDSLLFSRFVSTWNVFHLGNKKHQPSAETWKTLHGTWKWRGGITPAWDSSSTLVFIMNSISLSI